MSSEEIAGSSLTLGPRKKKRKFSARIPPCRVKRVMQIDEDIGRMTASVPVVLGRTMEHFAERLLIESAAIVQNSESRTLNIRHIKEAVARNQREFAFLNPLVDGIIERKDGSATSSIVGIPTKEKAEQGTLKKRRASTDMNGRKKKREKGREDDWDEVEGDANGSQGDTSDSASSGIQTIPSASNIHPILATTLSPSNNHIPALPEPAAAPHPLLAAPVSVIIKMGEGDESKGS